jgi:hypothetical protein
MMKLPFASTDQLAEALYYAYAGATLAIWELPDDVPRERYWAELPPLKRVLWLATAARLVALHGIPDLASEALAKEDPPEAREFLPNKRNR